MPKWKSWPWREARAAFASAVTAADQPIDALVYDLYGLTAEEIQLVEGTA